MSKSAAVPRGRRRITVPIFGIFARQKSHKSNHHPGGREHIIITPERIRKWKSISKEKASETRRSPFTSYRVKKSSKSSRKSTAKEAAVVDARERVLHDFVASIRASREEIADEVSNALYTAEGNLVKRLSRAAANYHDKLNNSSAPDSVTTSSTQSAHPPTVTGNNTSLDDARRTLEVQEKALERHWKNWVKIQGKIICLGVEVLGTDKLSLDETTAAAATGGGGFGRRFRNAVSGFDGHVSMEREVEKAAEEERDAIVQMARDAVKQSVTQEK
ncbi:hypothetical protein AJ80_10049, partial [Polytolypa hystricis UAMH7299]